MTGRSQAGATRPVRPSSPYRHGRHGEYGANPAAAAELALFPKLSACSQHAQVELSDTARANLRWNTYGEWGQTGPRVHVHTPSLSDRTGPPSQPSTAHPDATTNPGAGQVCTWPCGSRMCVSTDHGYCRLPSWRKQHGCYSLADVPMVQRLIRQRVCTFLVGTKQRVPVASRRRPSQSVPRPRKGTATAHPL